VSGPLEVFETFFFVFFGRGEEREKINEKCSLFRPFFSFLFPSKRSNFFQTLQQQVEEDPGERSVCVRGDDSRGRGEEIVSRVLKKVCAVSSLSHLSLCSLFKNEIK